MSKQEINNTVLSLWALHKSFDGYPSSDNMLEMKRKVSDVVHSDCRFEYFDRDNILRIFILNRKYTAVPVTWFGVHIDADSL